MTAYIRLNVKFKSKTTLKEAIVSISEARDFLEEKEIVKSTTRSIQFEPDLRK